MPARADRRRRSPLLAALAAALALAAPSAASPDDPPTSELVATGLDAPLFAAAPAGDPRLFIVERPGRIRILAADGTLLPTPFLDIASRVSTSGERGLLGLAFPADHAASGLFYVYYTDSPGGRSVVSRFSVSADPDVADPAETVLLVIDQPASNHNGGTIAFGPDGFLYFSPGDGGGSNDPDERAQDPDDLLGKMLRLDVGVPPAPDSLPVPGQAYRIPADNPFVGDDGVRDEIWALGLRNPYRFSFDRLAGDLWIADVGQGQREEIDFEPLDDPGGRNWGWDVMEGTRCNTTDPAPAPPCNDPSLSLPVHEYAHSGGNCSVTGGYLYRGKLTALQGLYLFGDYCTGRIWSLDPATLGVLDRSAELRDAAGAAFELVGFGEDGSGELLVVHLGGSVYRVVAETECRDGADNDGDGRVDFDGGVSAGLDPPTTPDPHCAGPTDDREKVVHCGLGAELALVLPLLVWARRLRRRRPA